MTREQTLQLAKSVKAIGVANQPVSDLAMELLVENPKLSLAIITEATTIAEANYRLLDIVKEHSKKYLQNT